MTEDVRITSVPDTSAAKVGYDLFIMLLEWDQIPNEPQARKKAILDLYAECRHAAAGYRSLPK
ncbi:MAG: hypothetical protein VR78_19020 [Hoeflea sp. BRH_c9]|nr:MAG: hypothetical protein VR78_19020 [Hoeflea sp. BRH_c9]